MAKPQSDHLMQFLDESGGIVSTFTGVKQQFIAAGWNEHNAERAVIAMINASSK